MTRGNIRRKIKKACVTFSLLATYKMIQVVLKPDVFLNQDLLERETKNQEKYEKEKGRLVKFTEVCFLNMSCT